MDAIEGRRFGAVAGEVANKATRQKEAGQNADEVLGLVAPERQPDARLLTEGNSSDKTQQDPSQHGLRSVGQPSPGVLHVTQVS